MRCSVVAMVLLAAAAALAGQRTALTVNGRAVSAADYGLMLRLLGAPAPLTLPPADRRAEAERYLNFESLVSAARAQGIEQTPEFQRRLAAREQQILVQMLYQRLRKQSKEVSPSEINAYYRQHAADFIQLHLARLYIPYGQGTVDAATAFAAKLRTRALQGQPFAKLEREVAKRYGGDTAADAVDIGWHQPGTLALSAADDAQVFALEAGEVSPVLSEDSGVFLIQALARRDVPEAVARQQIRQQLAQQRLAAQTAQLRQALHVELNPAYFDAPAQPRRRAVAAPPDR